MTDFSLEKAAMARGCAAVCGCDEAGAGPLMGPVYAAAVILPVDGCIPGLDDSKKLTEKKREALFDVICQQAAAWAVASVSAEEIDATDILSARMKAMQLAIDALAIPADYALIDGNRDHGRSAAITTPHETGGGRGRALGVHCRSVGAGQGEPGTGMCAGCWIPCTLSISSPGIRATAPSCTMPCWTDTGHVRSTG